MVSTREPYELSSSSERRYSLQRFIPHAPNVPKAGAFKFPQSPESPAQAFDSILHKELHDHVYHPQTTPKPLPRPRDSSTHRRDPSIIVSIRHYHIMLKSLQEGPDESPRNSWVYDPMKLKTTDCCKICRRSFVHEGKRPICSLCAAIKSAYEYHETLRPKSSCTLNYIPRSTPRQSWMTSNSFRPSTLSWSEGQSSLYRTETSSTYQLPNVCILISRTRVCYLPGLSHQYILERLSNIDGVETLPLFREHGANSRTSNDADGKSITDSLGPKRNSKIAKPNRSSGFSGMSGSTGSSRDSLASSARKRATKKRKTSTRFGCPFAKRNPCRYEKVIGSCTTPPGMEMKYIVEHLERTHSPRLACPWCHVKWPANSSWTEQLHDHTVTNPCSDTSDQLEQPEPLTEAQLATLDAYKADRHTEPEPTRWVNLFMALFPDEFPIPNPYYDFYTPTHLIRPSRQQPRLETRDSESVAESATNTSSPSTVDRDSGRDREVHLPSSDSMSTLLTGSASGESMAPSSNRTSVVQASTSPMILATTAIEELDPGFEPLSFDEKIPGTSGGMSMMGGPFAASNVYDSAETMVMDDNEGLTFGQFWNSHVGNPDISLAFPGELLVERPADGQDPAQFLETLPAMRW